MTTPGEGPRKEPLALLYSFFGESSPHQPPARGIDGAAVRPLIQIITQRLATAGHRALLSSDKPLLVSACNGLCSTTPALAFRAQPKPTQSLRTAEIRRKYLSAVAPTAS